MTTTYGILSTYPPTQCGLATFSAALVESLRSPGDIVSVAAVGDARRNDYPPEVTHQWVRGSSGGAAAVAAHLNSRDVVIVQHEYGIFGGQDGVDVLAVCRALTVPLVAVLHTVLTAPTLSQRDILNELVALSDVVVTMTWTARQRLVEQYGVDPGRIVVIPHGAGDTHLTLTAATTRATSARPVVLTWGLLGEGKGIEWGIAAMAALRDLDPQPLYRIVGETHPKVVEREGEAYRRMLVAESRRLGVDGMVAFEDRYLATKDLQRIVQDADIILLPYDSLDQVTSGVLVEAITAGKPVVSTRFPHAVELLAGGVGALVDRQHPEQIADALRTILADAGVAERMSAKARSLAPELLWSAVGARYRDLAGSLAPVESVAVSA